MISTEPTEKYLASIDLEEVRTPVHLLQLAERLTGDIKAVKPCRAEWVKEFSIHRLKWLSDADEFELLYYGKPPPILNALSRELGRRLNQK